MRNIRIERNLIKFCGFNRIPNFHKNINEICQNREEQEKSRGAERKRERRERVRGRRKCEEEENLKKTEINLSQT